MSGDGSRSGAHWADGTAIDLVLFDLDDTLLDHRTAVERGIASHVTDGPHRIADIDLESATRRWHELEHRHYHRYLAGELTMAGQRRARAADFVTEFHRAPADDAAADAWFDAYFERYRTSWVLFEDALRSLDALTASGAQLGLITNGDEDYQRVKLDRLGLSDRFLSPVFSGAEGVSKPDPAIFTTALARHGVDPSRAVYIGDRLRTDAIGAARAGLHGVWLTRGEVDASALGHGDAAPSPAQIDAEVAAAGVRRVSSLDEFTALLLG
ncbi:HAD family hydrolase [Mycetocola reblochoni]|uniref:2-haloalkanoic acid dehalogenase n=2 Tax=Mycetocola reblochoni TaxID=331618 RepID=A0A1R4JIM3_9MICO|nr:HAD-IA family hydrolase [Mycetocola reblochoni]RLP70533.1 HAD family hydrolase [Mycetocola reblochoni]SJN31868.1 2-haloalkanoic acid dehalogenase [Mycetocola reblochoni REB411]